jgi:hypothetical protein
LNLNVLIFSCWSAVSAAGAAGATASAVAGAAVSVASVSLSEPLSESPSITAAVTKDKILSIDLEASSFDGITLLHEDQS